MSEYQVSPWNYSVTLRSNGSLRIENWTSNEVKGDGVGAKISGGSKGDYIHNCNERVKIDAGGGNDTIENKCRNHPYGGSYATIHGDSGNDRISYRGNNSKIYGDDGDDTISNYGSTATISGGEDNDKISNGASKSKIYGNNGDDTIDNGSDNVTISGGDGNDKIINENGSTVSIDAGAGNDYIVNWQDEDDVHSVTINGGADNDTIINEECYGISINGGIGDDSIVNDGEYGGGHDVTIDGGSGNDLITNNRSDNVSINGGTGKNTINNGLYDGKVVAQSFSLKESLYGGEKVTIVAGKNDDYIFNRGNEASISAGDGKNTIVNGTFFGDTATSKDGIISIFAILASVKGGNSVTIEAGKNDDSIQSFGSSKVTIDSGAGNDKISLVGGGSNISVKGGAGDDSIFARTPKDLGAINSETSGVPNDDSYKGSYLTVEAGSGKNFVSISSAWSYVTIEGGDTVKGIDIILNEATNALIKGNAGNDYISNTGDNAIIFSGDHGDIIENYGDKAFIEGDKEDSSGYSKIGDFIITDKGDDVTIDGGAGPDTITAYHDVRASICGGAGNDQIILQRLSADDVNKLTVGALKPVLQLISFKTKVPIPTNLVDAILAVGALVAGKNSSRLDSFNFKYCQKYLRQHKGFHKPCGVSR